MFQRPMANTEHLRTLFRGPKAWNAWRSLTPRSKPDLSGADLRGVALKNANLRDANLSGTVLIDTDLSGANLTKSRLTDADLRESILHGAVLYIIALRYGMRTCVELSSVGPTLVELTLRMQSCKKPTFAALT